MISNKDGLDVGCAICGRELRGDMIICEGCKYEYGVVNLGYSNAKKKEGQAGKDFIGEDPRSDGVDQADAGRED